MLYTTRLIQKTCGLIISGIASLLLAAGSWASCIYSQGPADAAVAMADNNHTGVASAWYGGATDIYAHGVLGDAIEAKILYATGKDSEQCALEFTLDDHSVFEDITPRIADVTGDGKNDVIVIESHVNHGASLAIYGITGNRLKKIASTPHIGQRYRWLAPAGIADFNADGVSDVAYVQTPHIGGVLQIWSFKNEVPALLAEARGFSNHRIGESTITGGIKHCSATPSLILPDQNWSQLLSVVVKDGAITSHVIGRDTSADAISRNLRCP